MVAKASLRNSPLIRLIAIIIGCTGRKIQRGHVGWWYSQHGEQGGITMTTWWETAWQWLVTAGRHPVLLVFLGGGLGSASRYLVGAWFTEQPWARGFPWGTLTINFLGSFLLALCALGILVRLPEEYAPLFLLLGTGFCGGFTTFSTYEWEGYTLWREGLAIRALGYLLGSVLAGMLGVLLAVILLGEVKR